MNIETLLAYWIPHLLQQTIYIISTNLLYPVMIVLIILIAGSLIELGGFLFEWHNRHRDLGRMEEGAVRASTMLDQDDLTGAFNTLGQTCSNSFVHEFLYRLSAIYRDTPDRGLLEVRLEKVLHDIDFDITKKLERSRFVARAGPMFGLMGTLIPMGPALLGLSRGDIEALANNLIIAFGTTVVGLMAGVIGLMVLMVRTRWYRQDMSDIEYLAEILHGDVRSSGTAVRRAAPVATEITATRPDEDEGEILGVIKTISSRSWEAVHNDMIFTRSGLIVAKTAGSVLANPTAWMGGIVCLNAVLIIAGVGIPFAYFLFINLIICVAFLIATYSIRMRARSGSERLMRMPANSILADDMSNFEIPYSEIARMEIDKSRNTKILTDSGWIETGRVERSSLGSMGVLHVALQDRVVEV
jgi:biopolymer transport protein ExbB/TolQ